MVSDLEYCSGTRQMAAAILRQAIKDLGSRPPASPKAYVEWKNDLASAQAFLESEDGIVLLEMFGLRKPSHIKILQEKLNVSKSRS